MSETLRLRIDKHIDAGGDAYPDFKGDILECTVLETPTVKPETGWSEPKRLEDGARRIYVAPVSGSDVNPGVDPAYPLKTLRRARDLAKPNAHILLKRGSIFQDQDFGLLNIDGLHVGAYGEGPLPVIRPIPGDNGMRPVGDGIDLRDIVIEGPDDVFAPRGSGITSVGPLTNFRLENVTVRKMGFGFTLRSLDRNPAPLENITLHRSRFLDGIMAVKDGDEVAQRYSSGIFCHGTKGLRIVECITAGNGFREGLREPGVREPGTHGIYITHSNERVVIQGVVAHGNSQNGIMCRTHADLLNNFMARNVVGLVWGTGKTTWHVTGNILGNAVVEGVLGKKDASDSGFSWGFNLHDINIARIADNLAANALTTASNVRGYQIGQTFRNVTMRDNTAWAFGNGLDSSVDDMTGTTIEENLFAASGRYQAYRRIRLVLENDTRLGVSPLNLTLPADLDAKLRSMERGAWDEAYTAAGLAKPWRTALEGVR